MTSTTVLIASGISIVFILVLFFIEEKRGSRFVPRVRTILDGALLWLYQIVYQRLLSAGWTKVRIIVHFLLHSVLSGLVYVFQKTQDALSSLLYRNKRIAHQVLRQNKSGHLSKIKEHKDASALSDKEKNTLREKHLNGL